MADGILRHAMRKREGEEKVIGVRVCECRNKLGAESRLKLEEGGLSRFRDDAASNYGGLIECILLCLRLILSV